MKKIISAFVSVALLFVSSCQKDELGKIEIDTQDSEVVDFSNDPMKDLTVFVPSADTKLSFSEDETNYKILHREFSSSDVGQQLIGCTKVGEEYKSFAYRIESINDVTGGVEIQLEKFAGDPGVPSNNPDNIVHFIYAPGHSCENITSEGTLQLDISSQTEGIIPAIMTATGTVEEDNSVTLSFENQTAILAIVPPDEGSMLNDCNGEESYTGCSFAGVKINALTKATLKFDETDGTTVSDVGAGIAEITKSDSGTWTEESTIYSAVFPGSCDILATIVGVKQGSKDLGDFEYAPASTTTVKDNAYLRIKKPFCHVAEAKVGDKKYDTFAGAMEAANKAGASAVVTLLRDCEVKVKTDVTNTNGVTLDLNGKTLTEDGTNRFTLETQGATLTIRDSDDGNRGNIVQKKSTSFVFQLKGGCLTIESGNISSPENSTGESKSSCISISDDGGVFTMTGGQIKNYLTAAVTMSSEYGTINISENAVVTSFASNAVAASNGIVNISGGFFKCGSEASVLYRTTADMSGYSVSGGYYSKAVTEVLLASGYSNHLSDDYEGYSYKVDEKPETVAIFQQKECEEQAMPTIRAAVDAANNATDECTITLVEDCVVTQDTENPNADIKKGKVTLNLNGHKLSQNGTSRVGVADEGYLIITDTETGGMITQSSISSNIIRIQSGKLEIAGGSIRQAEGSSVVNVYATGTASLIVSGGKVDASGYAVQFSSTGKLTISGGEIIGNPNSKSNQYALYLTSGTIEISDGLIQSGYPAIKLNTGSPALTITGGTIKSTGSNAVSASKGQLTVEGGFLSCPTDVAIITKPSGSTAELEINGGYYSKTVKSEYLLETMYGCYETKEYENYPWSVLPTGDVLFREGDNAVTTKKTIADAIDAANGTGVGACKIILTKSCGIGDNSKDVANSAGVTIDLNGFTLTQNKTKRLGLSGSGHLIVTDNKTGGTITQDPEADNSFTFNITSGTLDIMGGTIKQPEAKGTATINVDGATLNVSDDAKILGNQNHALQLKSGTVNINGGEVSSTANYALNLTGGTVNINGGEVSSTKEHTIYANNTTGKLDVTVKGGKIVATAASRYAVYVCSMTGQSSFTINGGDFQSKYTVVRSGKGNNVNINVIKGEGNNIPYFYTHSESSKPLIFSRETQENGDPKTNANVVTYGYFGGKLNGFSVNATKSQDCTKEDVQVKHGDLTYTVYYH